MCQVITLDACNPVYSSILGEYKFLEYGISQWQRESTIPNTLTQLLTNGIIFCPFPSSPFAFLPSHALTRCCFHLFMSCPCGVV